MESISAGSFGCSASTRSLPVSAPRDSEDTEFRRLAFGRLARRAGRPLALAGGGSAAPPASTSGSAASAIALTTTTAASRPLTVRSTNRLRLPACANAWPTRAVYKTLDPADSTDQEEPDM